MFTRQFKAEGFEVKCFLKGFEAKRQLPVALRTVGFIPGVALRLALDVYRRAKPKGCICFPVSEQILPFGFAEQYISLSRRDGSLAQRLLCGPPSVDQTSPHNLGCRETVSSSGLVVVRWITLGDHWEGVMHHAMINHIFVTKRFAVSGALALWQLLRCIDAPCLAQLWPGSLSIDGFAAGANH